jgi:alkyl sulfatase BDS1-like metallo-beta-lactamase superfamily hydrolase
MLMIEDLDIGADARVAADFGDTADFEDARRGFIGSVEPGVVRTADSRVIWDNDAYAFLFGDCPETANPSLWRQSRLVATQGLFQVTEGIYQVRGLDLSNMTLVEGERGVIVIDPLISTETAAAALALYRRHRGDRPVTAVIYTHSHVDHFGGVRGVTDAAAVAAGRVPVIAPQGFLEHAVAENVFAGPAMGRRAAYMYGATLPKGPAGQIGAGLGMATSTGTIGLIAPTTDIVSTGQEETFDGVRMIFQLTPGSEAPAEMNFFFPDRRALCVAENACHTLHNVLTLRGALVRDPHLWARYLTETIQLFADGADVIFASHHWPTWGRKQGLEFLSGQRDVYAYLHDQTLRLMNKGYTGSEIAEMLTLPPALDRQWHTRGYYGSLSHNVKAVYQRYMGWFDGNPAHLWEHPPAEASRRYVEFMGGADAVLAKARQSMAAGDLRWVVQVVNHVVFADPDNADARELQALALERLGYGSENGTWRNFYLTGASELRGSEGGSGEGQWRGNRAAGGERRVGGTPSVTSPDMMVALTAEQVFDALAVRIDGPRAAATRLLLGWELTDTGERFTLLLANGVLTTMRGDAPGGEQPAATISLTRQAFVRVLTGQATVPELLEAGQVRVDGNHDPFGMLMSLLDEPDNQFAIVTP